MRSPLICACRHKGAVPTTKYKPVSVLPVKPAANFAADALAQIIRLWLVHFLALGFQLLTTARPVRSSFPGFAGHCGQPQFVNTISLATAAAAAAAHDGGNAQKDVH